MSDGGILRNVKDFVMPSLFLAQGRNFSSAHVEGKPRADPSPFPAEENPLEVYFNNHRSGPGIWKWLHYFDIYHRHLKKFRGRKVNILEIGIYSGGSLGMWLDYFGEGATIYGVDIEPDCKAFESDRIKVSIGNQADRGFWREFNKTAPAMDVVIDDGSHLHGDQIVSLEELLPVMSRGGVYVCEDVHDRANRFASYVYGLADRLNDPATETYQWIEGVSLYPFVTIIEKRDRALSELAIEKHGTEWQPPEFGVNSTRNR